MKKNETKMDLKVIVMDILSTLEKHQQGWQSDVDSMINEKNDYTEGGIRYWGKWNVPKGEVDDGDYDWKVLDESSHDILNEEIDKISARYPKVKITYSMGGKCYIYIRVEK